MADESDFDYNMRRERAERLAAERATIPAARFIHTSMADRYAKVARNWLEETGNARG